MGSTSLLVLGCLKSNISLHIFFKYYSAVFIYTFLFTPIFITLTQSISSDTVLRLQILFFIIHLISLDYFSNDKNINTVASNTATFAIISMVSRFDLEESS